MRSSKSGDRMSDKKNRGTWRITLLFVGWLFCLLLPVSVVKANEMEQKIVRVAFPEQEGMSYVEANGACNGYNYEYLEKVSEYTGWKIEYVKYTEKDQTLAIQKAMDDLEAGNVDLMGPILKSEDTQERYLFPKNSYGTVYTTLNVLESSNLTENTIREKQLLRIGVLKQAKNRNEEVKHYLESEKINYELVPYEDTSQQTMGLLQDQVDVITSVSLMPINGTKIIEKFAPQSYYFAISKGNEELATQLDDAIEKISQAEPYYQNRLFEKYFHNESVYFLSTEQVDYMDSIHTIRVLCIDNDAPYVYKKDGEPAGMLISLLEGFGELMDAKVEYTICKNREEALQLLADSSYDLMIGIPFTSEYCSQIGYIRGNMIIESEMVYVEHPKGSKKKTLAVVRGLEKYANTDSYDKVIFCDNARECIRKVEKKEADIGFGDQATLEYYDYEEGSNLVLTRLSGTTQDVCAAVNREKDVRFVEIFNMYLYTLGDGVKSQYLAEANVHTSRKSLKYYIKVYPTEAVVVIGFFTLLLSGGAFLLIYSRQMQKKNRELKTANEAKSEFLARMSHDIRTPMNGIMGMLDISDKMLDRPEKLKEYHQKIRKASEYLLSLINDVLDMSKLESREIHMTAESTDLVELIESCREILEIRAAERGITIESRQAEPFQPPRVLTSDIHLRQIFMNIVGNAIKYNKPNGKIFISARVVEQDEDSITCEFRVEDTGIGMSESFQKHMFEQFTQEQDTARSEYEGTGLGLAIVKQIIDQMDGTITVDSRKNEGTTFTWTLTFAIDHVYKRELTPNKKSYDVNLNGKKVLVAEDNQLNAEIISFLLEEWGAEVILAENGKVAVETFASAPDGTFDYILMDIMMPVMDGHEACRRIRAMDRKDGKEVPIIALSANAFVEDREKSREAGMNAHVTKPLDAEKLKKILARVTKE